VCQRLTTLEKTMTIRRSLLSVAIILGIVDLGRAQLQVVEPPPIFAEAERLHESIKQVASKLIVTMSDPAIDETIRERAITALGRLRPDDARGPLLDHLLFKASLIGEPGTLTYYPAAHALIRYGREVYAGLPRVLIEDRSPAYIYVLACLLHKIDGKQVAIQRIEKEMADIEKQYGANRRTATVRQNFARLISRLKTTDFDDPLNWPRANLQKLLAEQAEQTTE
jgi:hypothetical protein